MLFERWRAPIYRWLIPFTAGIILYNTLEPTRIRAATMLIGSLILAYVFSRGKSTRTWRWQPLVGLCLFLAVTCSGVLFTSLRDLRQQPSWIGNNRTENTDWLIEIREEATPTRSGWRLTADLQAYQDSTQISSIDGGIHLYTKQSAWALTAKPGDRFWISLPLQRIQNKPNASFDYARYCRQKKITHQSYVQSNTPIHQIPRSKHNLSNRLHRVQSEVRHQIYRALPDSSRAGLATALLIGWKGGLDPERKQHYTRTGTIHIIAISGLHVSLVFEILWRLLFPLLFLRGGALLRQLIALSCIWIFCFIAGAEASVLRAGIMFTAIALGRWMQRPVSGMQALGLSMLILLIADPDWLFDPGFQLSHAAVAGILLLHPVLVNVIRPQNRLLKSTWESACMTLAATACTLPLTSYYFHQFPWLFLPANLIAVPLSSLALLGLFFLIPLSIFQLPSEPTTWIITCILDGMNAWVEQLDRIPGAVYSW